MKKRKMLAALLAGTVLAAAPAHAALVNITNISGGWFNDNPDFSADGDTVISWGTPSGQPNQSSYTYTPATPPAAFNVPPDQTFSIGMFEHANFPVTGQTLNTVDLVVTTELTVDGTPQTVVSTFEFTHTETPNNDTPCDEGGSIPCPDLVEFDFVSGQSTSFDVGGESFVVDIAGFTLPDDTLVDQFLTLEEQNNTALLSGVIRSEGGTADVPNAPTLLLLSMGLLGLGGYVRARRQNV